MLYYQIKSYKVNNSNLKGIKEILNWFYLLVKIIYVLCVCVYLEKTQ